MQQSEQVTPGPLSLNNSQEKTSNLSRSLYESIDFSAL